MELLDNEPNQNIRNQLLRPEDLISLCLKSDKPDLTLRAFDIFTSTSSSFVRRHKALLEECWRDAADQNDWGELYREYTAEGWSDEEMLQVLTKTVLFQAARRCYGPEAEVYEEGIEEVMPLRHDNAGLRDSDSYVEAILMQHKYFPDAGKLMLMAVELGGGARGSIGSEEGPLPME